jgi:hypothetical protein
MDYPRTHMSSLLLLFCSHNALAKKEFIRWVLSNKESIKIRWVLSDIKKFVISKIKKERSKKK